MNKVKQLIVSFRMAGLSKKELNMCLPEVRKRNVHMLNWMLPTIITILLILTVVAYVPGSGEEGNRFMYMAFAIITSLEFLVYRLVFRKRSQKILIMSYAFMVTLYCFGMFEAVFIGQDSTSVVYCIFTVAVPVLVIDRPSKLGFLSIVMEAVLLFLHGVVLPGLGPALSVGTELGDQFVVINSLASTLLGIICGYVIQKTKFSDIKNHLMLEVQRDTDVMTGAKSRVAYVRDLGIMNNTKISAGILFADVNGLKKANDSLGHEAGDLLIKNAYALMEKYFYEYDDCIYRIGGDEFVIISKGVSKPSFESRMQKMIEDKDNNNLISTGGMWFGRIEDTEAAVKQAEKLMYAAKGKYYAEHPEKDRRVR